MSVLVTCDMYWWFLKPECVADYGYLFMYRLLLRLRRRPQGHHFPMNLLAETTCSFQVR